MSQAEHRYDRLAVRLSLIISRLLAGETLSVNKLAVEFGVSVRTLRRDFRERLMYLNLEYRHGHCRLLSDPGMAQRAPGTLSFMRNVGLHDVFPETDLRLVNTLTDSEGISPCLVWQGGAESASVRPGLFSRLVDTIVQQQCIRVLADGVRAEHLAPYRLIYLEGEWYLAGEQHGGITVLPLSSVTAITVLSDTFQRRDAVCHLTRQEAFIRALPHFPVISDVMAVSHPAPPLLQEATPPEHPG
ncbi:WYL domain-containing protein [Enterobacter asburiae]|uniref:DeoR family transcriptional regulator n=1 Tax=Enterobacter cloacae complex TaxID=354276 RepID=UPI000667E7AC|nr:MULTISPECIES: WYL domain-containing protein [Enterobacter cloacae complex]SSW82755.1 transcriptional regulator [Klebsiella pneumoniae]MCK7380359.1 WYL domain-containing protein [Enterobacter cloacae]MCM7668459.1 WYL domain-containing protein [Enterobacter asburiae]MDU4080916.1 WYL domain-containing protein [Enterobacter asburiae]HCR2106302.1 WYL domain-containing protein [Enterobacter asburiae]